MRLHPHCTGNLVDFQVEKRDPLAQVVVQLPRDSPALLLLADDQAASEPAIEFGGASQLCDVADDADDAVFVGADQARLEVAHLVHGQFVLDDHRFLTPACPLDRRHEHLAQFPGHDLAERPPQEASGETNSRFRSRPMSPGIGRPHPART